MNLATLVYYLGISALFTHELDAVMNMEWRLLYHLRTLPDASASSLFIAAHLPLFFAFFYFGHHKVTHIQARFRALVAAFLIVHSVLHFRLAEHTLYQFEGWLSNLFIYGAGLCGVVYLVLCWSTLFNSAPKQ